MITASNVSQHLNQYHCWDLAGIDGLQAAQLLFGDAVVQIAPFQSLETSFEQSPCAVLRLCEGNFRIALWGDASPLEQALQPIQTKYHVWIRQFDWLSAIVIPESLGLTLLPNIATTKPPYRLQGLAIDRAVPARIEGISVLIWRHAILGQSAFELHLATKDRERVKAHLGL